MFDIQRPIPAYLLKKKNIVNLVVFTALFALVFINLYAPFGVTNWYEHINDWQLLLYSSVVILTGVLVVAVSRIIMYLACKNSPINYWQFGIWLFAEITFMALFYALFIKLVLMDNRFILDILKISAQNTALILLLPYSVMWLYFSWDEKKQQLNQLTYKKLLPDNSQQMVAFFDEKGIMRLSVKMENLLYLEASDNYVNVFYINKEKINRFLLRNSLKKLESMFEATEVSRCHRSYMINFKKVKVLRKNKDGINLEMDIPGIDDIPVSKTYAQNVMDTFMQFTVNSEP